VPYAWDGMPVVALVIVPGGWGSNYPPLPLRAEEQTGMLESVNDLGIVATLAAEDDEETPVSTFYPWSAVLSLRPQ
jgi:hypothetical protein